MKKTIITLCVLMLTAASAFAGGDKQATRYYTPKFTQGWFIDLAGTYSIFAAGGSAYHHMGTWYGDWPAGVNPSGKLFIGGSAKIGRRVSPSVALRLGYDLHRSGHQPVGQEFETFRYKNLHFDVMESPLDLFFGYKPDRFFTLWVYGGMGLLACDHGAEQGMLYGLLPGWDSNFEFGFNGGFINSFRLSNSFDFHIDLTATAMRWSFDDVAITGGAWHRAHFDFTAEAGFMWYLGGRRLDAAEPAQIITNDCSEQERRIQELTEELNKCRANQGGNVVAQPCDTIVKFVEGESISYPFSIFFNKGSYELRDGRDRINLQEFANAAKANGYKIILRGTCDSATASSAFNKTLAENRCNKIKAELVKMGVAESNITINPVGGVKELTPAEYDRRVLIQLSK